MSLLNTLIHKNNNTQEKARFFLDSLSYLVRTQELQIFESPYSLVEKISYQIENNSKKWSVRYITNHLKSFEKFLFMKDDFKNWNGFQKHIETYGRLKNDLKFDLVQSESFRADLDALRRELKSYMLKRVTRRICSMLECEHPLRSHQKEIFDLSEVLLSELKFRGLNFDQFNNSTQKIFSKEISEFPFPKKIKTKEDKQKYLENRTLLQQLEGYSNLVQNKKGIATLYFKVSNIKADRNFEFNYNGIKFTNRENPKFKKLLDFEDPFIQRFYKRQGTVIASCRVKYGSMVIARQDALERIKDAIQYFNQNRSINATVNPFFCLIKDFGSRKARWWEHRNFSGVPTSEIDFNRLNDNAFRLFSRKKIKSKEYFLQFEKYFVTAIETRRLSDYWQYLEMLLSTDREKNIFSLLPNILLLNEKSSHLNRFHSYLQIALAPMPWGIKASELGISRERQRELYYLKEPPELKPLNTEIQHPFINFILAETIKLSLSKKAIIQKNKSLLLEIYEQRNFFVHSGIEHELARLKLEYTTYYLSSRMRWILFEYMEKHPAMSFPEILDQIEIDADRWKG